ncbi:DUF4252 domain-containing protein [Flavobacterium agricola]|uniref:DUF4252 domain-containing protein n=1 Tax=Flavobacterium agricola TaxID=2870839 RepID=A0ABY6LW60_9FLAO|nr:DUF4252 domain-containing protein [Flavobacterium agricola]UYW00476.1 DUF4252 domain-containing protein [Flavobacterium agricola]
MRKLTLLLFLLFTSLYAQAQAVFEPFEKHDKVKAVVVNKKMFDLMSKIKVDPNDTNAQNYLTLIKNLDYLRVLTTVDAPTAKLLVVTTNDYLSKNPLQEITNALNNGKLVKVYVKNTKNSDLIAELLMLIEDQQSANNITVMTLSGNFSLKSLSALTDKMDLPGSEAINNLSK